MTVEAAKRVGGGSVIGSESINDYGKTPAAVAALNNPGWGFVLRQKAESAETRIAETTRSSLPTLELTQATRSK